jgi:hypothetical protein
MDSAATKARLAFLAALYHLRDLPDDGPALTVAEARDAIGGDGLDPMLVLSALRQRGATPTYPPLPTPGQHVIAREALLGLVTWALGEDEPDYHDAADSMIADLGTTRPHDIATAAVEVITCLALELPKWAEESPTSVIQELAAQLNRSPI